ncbi:MAG: Ig-like domain-containing protein [Methanosarcinaceae archaeon]
MKGRMTKTGSIRLLILLSVIVLSASLASALQPNQFYGHVTLNGSDAPTETVISASIEGEPRGSIVLVSTGEYGYDMNYLDVSGDVDDDGKIINFTVGGVYAEETAVWSADELPPQVLDLSAGGAPGDTTPPDISIVSPSSGPISDTESITVSGTASDDVGLDRVEVKLESGAWMVASGTESWNIDVTLSLGQSKIYAKAIDTSENSDTDYIEVEYKISSGDDTPPNITIVSPSQGDTFATKTVTVSGTAADDVGLDSVKIRVGSGDWMVASGTESWNTIVTLIQGQPNTIDAIATDTSGNSGETSVTVTYNPPSGGFVPSSGATPTGTDTQPVSGNVSSVTPKPTATGTSTPATTLTKAESGAEPEETKGLLPGFEAMFAIAGLLTVAYMLRRR